MTKKHFDEDLAARLSLLRLHHEVSPQAWRAIIEAMANFCSAQNPRFVRDRFIAACEKGGRK